jgi:hypothetical protein
MQEKPDNVPAACSLCGKAASEIIVLTSVEMDINSQYIREDGLLENMNGLRKHTRECFCEECFSLFTDKISALVTERQNAAAEIKLKTNV